MTKDELQTIFKEQIAAGITTIFFMLYEDTGNGGTKCVMESGSLADLDALATTLAEYNYVDPNNTPTIMPSFVSNMAKVAVTNALVPIINPPTPTVTSIPETTISSSTPETTTTTSSSTASSTPTA